MGRTFPIVGTIPLVESVPKKGGEYCHIEYGLFVNRSEGRREWEMVLTDLMSR